MFFHSYLRCTSAVHNHGLSLQLFVSLACKYSSESSGKEESKRFTQFVETVELVYILLVLVPFCLSPKFLKMRTNANVLSSFAPLTFTEGEQMI